MSQNAGSNQPEGRLFNVRRLVALDMGLHGSTFILLEFGLGVPIPMALGLTLVFRGFALLGLYIFTIGFNYVPPLSYAISLRNNYHNVVDMATPDAKRLVRKYSMQQFLFFIPFFIVLLDAIQRVSLKK
jgi:hypothetical protein